MEKQLKAQASDESSAVEGVFKSGFFFINYILLDYYTLCDRTPTKCKYI